MGNLVIISMISSNWGAHGGGGVRFLAFDKNSGEMVWWSTTGIRPSNTYRCVPVVTTINGQRILISGGGDGHLHAFQVNTGKKVWSFEFGNGAMNPAPVVDGNHALCRSRRRDPGARDCRSRRLPRHQRSRAQNCLGEQTASNSSIRRRCFRAETCSA